jgi:hypothetical protein
VRKLQLRVQKWLNRAILTAVLCGLPFTSVQAAKISQMRGGVKDTRARIVMNIDEPITYKAETSGKKLTVLFNGSTDRTRTVRLRDKRIRQAVLEPAGKKSRLVITFRVPVPEYKIFLLKKPHRIVIDFPKSGSQSTSAGNAVLKGVYYKEDSVNMGAGNVNTYVLTVTPKSAYRLDFIPGYGHTIQKGTLTRIARRSGAKALINASYFDSDIWVVGNLKIKNKWLGMESTPRTGLVIRKNGTVTILPKLAFSGTVTRKDGQSMEINGLNRMRLENELIYFNNGYDDSTDTNQYGTEVAVRNGKAINKGKGNMKMFWNMVVLSGNGPAASFLNGININDPVKIVTTLGNAEADAAPSVGTAGPMLVYDGAVHVTSAEEEIASDIAYGRAPRTGVGVKRDGTVLLVVADGRSSSSAGMTLNEFARYFVRLGADRAMNFDGGGSSEMVVKGIVMNSPSDGKERPVRVALGLLPK